MGVIEELVEIGDEAATSRLHLDDEMPLLGLAFVERLGDLEVFQRTLVDGSTARVDRHGRRLDRYYRVSGRVEKVEVHLE